MSISALSAVFIASLLGSLHCVGMCGGFVALCSVPPEGKASSCKSKNSHLHFLYHLGRLLTYVFLGSVAGYLGQVIELSGQAMGVQRLAAILAGAVIVLWGLVSLLHLRGIRLFKKLERSTLVGRFVAHLYNLTTRRLGQPSAFALGLLSGVLPCGWLYLFVTSAAGTGSALAGALLMFAFWMGTVPSMLVLGGGLHFLSAPLRARVPLVTSIVMVCLGIATLMGKMNVVLPQPGQGSHEMKCH